MLFTINFWLKFFLLHSAAMKSKSAEMKDKLFEYIVNPTGTNSTERHVSSTDKLGKRYRNIAPVFSIDDDQDGGMRNFRNNLAILFMSMLIIFNI